VPAATVPVAAMPVGAVPVGAVPVGLAAADASASLDGCILSPTQTLRVDGPPTLELRMAEGLFLTRLLLALPCAACGSANRRRLKVVEDQMEEIEETARCSSAAPMLPSVASAWRFWPRSRA